MQQKEALPPLEKYETQKQNQTELRETNEELAKKVEELKKESD